MKEVKKFVDKDTTLKNDLKEELRQFNIGVSSVVSMHKSVFAEMKLQGYTEDQAFNFATAYILGSIQKS